MADMASEGPVLAGPDGFGTSLKAEAGKADVNDRKRLGDDTFEGELERRVRPKVDLALETPEEGPGEAEGEDGSQEELDTRLRALVEVASQRKGDSPLPKPPRSLFQAAIPISYGSAASSAPVSLNQHTQAVDRDEELPQPAPAARAFVEANLADSFLMGAPEGRHGSVHSGLARDAVLPQRADHHERSLEEVRSVGEAFGAEEEADPVSHPQEELREGEDEGGEMQMGEEDAHGFGDDHGFGAHPQQMYGGYEEHPQYAAHQEYAASEEAQQLAEHAGFGGGHMEADEECEALRSLDLVEVGFPRSSVEELQTLPQHDLITRVLDLEERISAVVREKQLEAAARQEAEDNAARYAEESQQLRQVVREKNGYKKGVLQEMAALEGPPPAHAPLAGRFTITREGSPGGGLRLEKGNKGKGKSHSPVKEKWKAEWKKAASRSQYGPPANLMGGEEVEDALAVVEGLRQPTHVKGFRSRKSGPAQATPASKLLAILGAEPDTGPQDDDEDDDEEEDGADEEYVAPPSPPPRQVAPAGATPARTSRAESTVGLDDLGEFLRTCCQAKQTGHMTLHRVLWYTYLAWRQKVASPRPSVSSGGVGLSQCMQKLGHRERLFTREIQAKKAGCKGYEGGGKYWMGLIVLDKALVKTGRQWLAKAKRTGGSNRVTFSRDSASIKVKASEPADEEENEDEEAAADL